jgi:predicted transcriptional regulator
MADPLTTKLSRRERQIMDLLFQRGSASAADVQESLPDPPGYSAVRAMLRTLEAKGHVRHREDGPRYVYEPTEPRETARRSALRHLVRTFFDNSAEQAMAALLSMQDRSLSAEELTRLSKLIDQAKREGR